MRRFAVIWGAIVPLVLLGATAALAQGNSINQGRHTICHATGSESNPFVVITPAKAGVYNGHLATSSGGQAGADHQLAEDIIPPFQYDANRDGTAETYSQNWDAEGQAIFNAGCEESEGGGGGGGTTTGGTTTGGTTGGGGAGAGGGGSLGEAAGGAGAGAGALPFTGLSVWIVLLVGFSLIGGGFALLRWVRPDH
jgi:hypothetical protein